MKNEKYEALIGGNIVHYDMCIMIGRQYNPTGYKYIGSGQIYNCEKQAIAGSKDDKTEYLFYVKNDDGDTNKIKNFPMRNMPPMDYKL
jgi:hypothetical protein